MVPYEHPYDTVLSGGLHFLTELIAWVAGVSVAIVLATIIVGVPRMPWLLRGAPA